MLVDRIANEPVCRCSMQEAQLPQRDRATRYDSKFVHCFTSHESYKGFKQKVTFRVIQRHW